MSTIQGVEVMLQVAEPNRWFWNLNSHKPTHRRDTWGAHDQTHLWGWSYQGCL